MVLSVDFTIILFLISFLLRNDKYLPHCEFLFLQFYVIKKTTLWQF